MLELDSELSLLPKANPSSDPSSVLLYFFLSEITSEVLGFKG